MLAAYAMTEPSPLPNAGGPPTLRRGASVGRYIILNFLGSGGMGVVYTAYDPELDRNVALKLMHGDRGGASSLEQRARFVLEARAIARLTHPNVVAVHDVGAHGEDLFIAMELVDGQSLKDWLATPRAPKAIIEVLLQAGRGLCASHAAGLVHRDFKPANVLVGNDGRVRVGDFGLAAPDPRSNPRARDVGISDGDLVGTPGYMAPEQLRAGPLDARTDQWSFAVTLYEALYGVRPFRSGAAQALEAEMASGRTVAPPAGRPAPAWLRRILRRALAADPEQRYPSMNELLADLAAHDHGGRRRVVAAGAVLALAALVATSVDLAATRRPQPDSCRAVAAELDGVWDGARKDAVKDAFLATSKPYAAAAWTAVEARLDRYAAGWVAQRAQACRATPVSGEQAAARVACLNARRAELGALAGLFSRGDAELVEHAAEAAQSLSRVEACADPRVLATHIPAATDPVTRERGELVQSWLSTTQALRHAGKLQAALDLGRAAAAEAHALGDRAGEGVALFLVGDAERGLGSFQHAEEHLLGAVRAAEAGRDDATVAGAWSLLVGVTGAGLGRPEDGLRHGLFAEAVLERMGGDGLLEAALGTQRGLVLRAAGRLGEAVAAYEQALKLEKALLPADDLGLAATLDRLGSAYHALARYPEAQAAEEQALAILSRSLGGEHPVVAAALVNLGDTLRRRGDYHRAEEVTRRALAIRDGLAPDDPEKARTLTALADIQRLQHRLTEAESLEWRAAAILARTYGAGSAAYAHALNGLGATLIDKGDLSGATAVLERALAAFERCGNAEGSAAVLSNLAAVYSAQGQHDLALQRLARARELSEKVYGAEHPAVAEVLALTGGALAAEGRYAEAEERQRTALAIIEKAFGAEHPRLAAGLRDLGRVLAAEQRHDEALAMRLRALAIDEKTLGAEHPDLTGDLTDVGESLLALGRASEAVLPLARAAARPAGPDQSRAEALLGRARRHTLARAG